MIRHAAPLPFGFCVEFEWTPPGRMDVRWSPDTPTGFRSRRAFMRLFDAYAAARAEFSNSSRPRRAATSPSSMRQPLNQMRLSPSFAPP